MISKNENQGNFMTKELNEVTTKRTKLCNKFLPEKTLGARISNNKQGNYDINLLCRTKQIYFSNIIIDSVTDNKRIWKPVKPLFSIKSNQKMKPKTQGCINRRTVQKSFFKCGRSWPHRNGECSAKGKIWKTKSFCQSL